MPQGDAPTRAPVPTATRPTSCRSTASITSSSTSATRPRPPTSTSTPSASGRVAYAGLETGLRDRTSHVLEQGRIRLVLTGTLRSDTEIARHHARHGDGVRSIALSVPDVDHAHDEAVRAAPGASRCPNVVADEHGEVRRGEHRHLRRHPAHLHRPLRATTGRSCPASRRASRTGRRPTRCCWRSTTSSATSSSATWRSGSASTRTSSGWSSWSTSPTRRSPPTTRR